MKRLLIMMALSLGVMVCFAQKAKSKQQRQRRVQPVERKLFYCSCAYQSYGLPADVVVLGNHDCWSLDGTVSSISVMSFLPLLLKYSTSGLSLFPGSSAS